ncbi:transcription-repair coupling factor [Chitinophagales bacterium]|nr:transcription-repair coupling factor [Chitinophagales bacterium]
MDTASLLEFYCSDQRVKLIADVVTDPTCPKLHLKGLVGSLKSLVAAAAYLHNPGPRLFILDSKEEAAYFQNDLQVFLEKKDVLFFPDSFKKPGDPTEINKGNVLMRAETMSKLLNTMGSGEIIVTYPEALHEKVVDTRILAENTMNIKVGEDLDVDFITEVLVEYGFEFADPVYEPGQYAIRGGIVDIYSFGFEMPYRIELFGEEVESIRIFDPITQNSKKKIVEIRIVPNIQSQFTSDQKTCLLELLPDNTVLWLHNWEVLEQRITGLAEKTLGLLDELRELEINGESVFGEDAEKTFVLPSELRPFMDNYSLVEFGPNKQLATQQQLFQTRAQRAFNKQFGLLVEDLEQKQSDGYVNFIFANNARQILRFQHIFEDMGKDLRYHAVKQDLQEGFVDEDLRIVCYTDHQIFNRYHKYKMRSSFSKRQALSIKLIRELRKGDFVTHIDHGVGRFSGLEKIEVNGKTQEAVRLIYKDNDLLYVGIHSLHKIAKYIGKEGRAPKINKLGSTSWAKLKTKTKSQIKDIAKDLILLYSKRRQAEGFRFSKDTFLQDELEASFQYEDTPDQEKATVDVKGDMEKPTPMDRLICGDVGFGKTEIAIRAAGKAVSDNKQVAILVPTTILAMQHFSTFKERFADFPVTIDYLNRFKTGKQKKETIAKLETGEIGIIIGTHALISKAVKFKDLGLLIVDEEQKFGVGAKEKIKELRVNVDTLTLTATPIPRTLQFSLMGARDLSIIKTPPPNRLPVNTEMMGFVGDKIRDAIYFEISRGGQVFFVHNRVRDLVDICSMIERLCPDLDVGMAHGQLKNTELEEKIMKFSDGTYDVLVSTNIIESGLDIPNANTMIINNAHQFGLSDLHQMRGRVGRSNKKAFCYLITPPIHGLPDDSQRRLKTIQQFSGLGGGFDIAMKDLDIRGAGNMLGGEQSGFIADIGFDTYQKILDEAITELKETEFKDLFKDQLQKDRRFVRDCIIESDLEMHFPNDYVQNVDERMSLYTELNKIENEADLIRFRDKIKDRFGAIPVSVNELIYAVRLKWIASRLGFERIIIKKGKLRCGFIENKESPFFESPIFTKVLAYAQSQIKHCQVKQVRDSLFLIFEYCSSMKDGREKLLEMEEFVSGAKSN